MSTKACWRCLGRGVLGHPPHTVLLSCRICHGSGLLVEQPFGLRVGLPKLSGLDRMRKALAGWWDKHISHLYDGPDEI